MKRTTIAMACAGAAAFPPAAARADGLACTPKVGKGAVVMIGKHATDIVAADDLDKAWGGVFAYPFDATHILVAWSGPGHYGRPAGSPLYLVDCKAPGKPKEYASGDFGHSELLPDGKTLVFSDGEGRGIGLFEIATKKAKGLTYPPTFKEGGSECDGREPGLHDIITRLDLAADRLEFQRGGSCGFEGDWTASDYVIERFTTKPSKPRRALPVATVAAGAGDVVWAATAPCGGAQAAIAWSSADLGATWTKHAVPKAASGIVDILVDARQPGHVLVETGKCTNDTPMGPMLQGGRFHVTLDGGATWQLLTTPDTSRGSTGSGFVAPAKIATTDGSLDHLALWSSDDDGHGLMWTSSDGGARWAAAKQVQPTPDWHTEAKAGGATLTASPDGVVVRRPGAPATRVYPYRAP